MLDDPLGRNVGDFQTEAATHAPTLAAALVGMSRHGPFVAPSHPLHPDAITGAVADPITALLAWPVFQLFGGTAGFAAAWNGWHLASLLGSAAGAWMLARAWLGAKDPGAWGAAAAAAVAAAAVTVHHAPAVGRTEQLAYPLYALHAAFLFRATRGGASWLPAVATVALVTWSGGYGAAFFAVTEPFVALWALSGRPRRETLAGLALVATVAALSVIPMLRALAAWPNYALDWRHPGDAAPSVGFAAMFLGRDPDPGALLGCEVPPFVGFATLGAALLAWRRAAWPLCIGLGVLLVGAGPDLGPLPGPATLLARSETFGLIRSWSRISAFALPILGVAAASLVAGRRGVSVILVLAVLGEAAWRRPVASSWSFDEETRTREARAAGEVVLELPQDRLERARRWLTPPGGPDPWRLAHDRPLLRYFEDTLPMDPPFSNRARRTPTWDACALREDAARLRAEGWTGVVLRTEALTEAQHADANAAIEAIFGPSDRGFWPLPSACP